MPTLHVCPLSRLEDTVRETGARHVVTLLSASSGVIRPASVPTEQHFTVIASDITESMEGHILANDDHVRRLIAFIKAWDRETPLVIHCYAGISRSTAAAYIAASVLNPALDEEHLAKRLRASSPSATPNARLIALADQILQRDGRMIRAIAGIGRGAEAFEGTPFELAYD
jgi:predicted protein tyrosine phosphatase